jgi:hypothetical protein
MKTVFADSFYFFALVNDRDPAHDKAVAFLQSYRGRMLTTDWIITELGDGLANRTHKAFGRMEAPAARLGESSYSPVAEQPDYRS